MGGASAPSVIVTRATFATRLGALATLVGVAIGLGNVWRFPYMVGSYGGAAFILAYGLAVALIGVPALMGEWALGRETRLGTLGAYQKAGLPAGKWMGRLIFMVVMGSNAYYTAVIGWVVWYGLAQLLTPLGHPIDGAWILPPESGFAGRSYLIQVGAIAALLTGGAFVVGRGLRGGIERISRILTPLLFVGLIVVMARSLTLDGAGAGVRWLLAFEPGSLTAPVAIAGLSQMVFSLALGGMFMVVYGSYLPDDTPLAANAFATAGADTAAGLLAGFAIFPAVFALGMDPGSGPELLFVTLPQVFSQLPAGWVWGSIFFAALGGAAFLSSVAALELLTAGLADTAGIPRRKALIIVTVGCFTLSLPPMLNMSVFVPWDLTFGSGMQTLGALAAAVTVGWALSRGAALRQLAMGTGLPEGQAPPAHYRMLYLWIRFVIPAAILTVGAWWVLTDLLGVVGG